MRLTAIQTKNNKLFKADNKNSTEPIEEFFLHIQLFYTINETERKKPFSVVLLSNSCADGLARISS